MQKPIVSSGNPGYIARVTHAFEEAGLAPQLDVAGGTMMICVPDHLVEEARKLISSEHLSSREEPPGPEFTHLLGLNTEDLSDIVRAEEHFSPRERQAAARLIRMREDECARIEDMMGQHACNTLQQLTPFGKALLGMVCLLFAPLAAIACITILYHKKSDAKPSFCPGSRRFAGKLLPFALTATTLFLASLFWLGW